MASRPQHRRDYRPIKDLLRQMREANGLRQEDLAERLKWWKSMVQKSESGERRLDIGEFVLWARGCGVDPVQAFTQYAETIPEGKGKVGPWPMEAREQAIEDRDRELAELLSKASSLIAPKPVRKRQVRPKSKTAQG